MACQKNGTPAAAAQLKKGKATTAAKKSGASYNLSTHAYILKGNQPKHATAALDMHIKGSIDNPMLSLSLSLSLTHTHTHEHMYPFYERT